MKHALSLAGLFALAAISGCHVYGTNDDVAASRGWAPSHFTGPARLDPVRTGEIDPGLRTTTLNRDHWPLIPITAWSAQPQHQPIYALRPHENDATARNQGKYPTAATSLDSVTTDGMNAQVHEALVAPFYAAADIVLFIPRAVRNGMCSTVENGLEPYERAPGPRIHTAARAGLLPPPAPAAKEPQR